MINTLTPPPSPPPFPPPYQPTSLTLFAYYGCICFVSGQIGSQACSLCGHKKYKWKYFFKKTRVLSEAPPGLSKREGESIRTVCCLYPLSYQDIFVSPRLREHPIFFGESWKGGKEKARMSAKSSLSTD